MTIEIKESDLRTAKPRLLCCVEGSPSGEQRYTPYISDVDLGWDELIEEGFDPGGSSGIGPVYYRIAVRADEKLYLSTFMASRDRVLKMWGAAGLAYCDPVTGMAAVRIETRLPPPEIMKQEVQNLERLAKGGNRYARRMVRAGRARGRRTSMEVKENDLRSAKPRLICCVENPERFAFVSRTLISDVDLDGDDELIEDGFEPSSGSGIGPVYYCHVVRAGEHFALGTFMAPRVWVLKAWGPAGLAYCDPATGLAPARIEARLSEVLPRSWGVDDECYPFTFLTAAQFVFLRGICGEDLDDKGQRGQTLGPPAAQLEKLKEPSRPQRVAAGALSTQQEEKMTARHG